MACITGEMNDVADVVHTREQHDQALKAHSEASVRDGAETPQVPVPPEFLVLHGQLVHPCIQHLQSFLALCTTNQFADAWTKEVHGCDCLTIVIQAHVKGFATF